MRVPTRCASSRPAPPSRVEGDMPLHEPDRPASQADAAALSSSDTRLVVGMLKLAADESRLNVLLCLGLMLFILTQHTSPY